MKFKSVTCSLLFGLGTVLVSQEAMAANYKCWQNPNAPLFPANGTVRSLDIVELDPGKYWGTNPLPQIDNPENFKCDHVIPGKTIDPSEVTSRQASIKGSSQLTNNITFNGKRFYKLTKTGNLFLDTYGYVSGEVSAIGEGGHRVEFGPNIKPLNVQADNAPPSVGMSLHDLQFLFTQAPTTAELGVLNTGLTFQFNVGTDTVTSDNANTGRGNLTFAFVPPSAMTCNVNADTIELQPMTQAQRPALGATYGKTNFSITAVCPSSAVDQALDYVMTDNIEYYTKDFLRMLSMSDDARTSNLGVRIEEQGSGTPITTHATYPFGTLAAGQTIIKKDFVAKYVGVGGINGRPGMFIAQGGFLVQYK